MIVTKSKNQVANGYNLDLSNHVNRLVTSFNHQEARVGESYIPNLLVVADGWSVNPQRIEGDVLTGFTGYVDESRYDEWDSVYPDNTPYRGNYGKLLQPLTQAPFWLQDLVRKHR